MTSVWTKLSKIKDIHENQNTLNQQCTQAVEEKKSEQIESFSQFKAQVDEIVLISIKKLLRTLETLNHSSNLR